MRLSVDSIFYLINTHFKDSQEQRGMAEHQPGMRKAGATAPTDEEEEEEEVEADNMAEDECRNVD